MSDTWTGRLVADLLIEKREGGKRSFGKRIAEADTCRLLSCQETRDVCHRERKPFYLQTEDEHSLDIFLCRATSQSVDHPTFDERLTFFDPNERSHKVPRDSQPTL